MRRALILAMAATTGLAGCGGKSGKAGGAPGGDDAAGSGEAASAPMRKAGLWTISRIRDGKPAGGMMKLCVDAGTDAQMSALGGGVAKNLCADQKSQRNADGSWSFSTTCQLGPAGMTKTSGTAHGDFSSHYVVHSESETANAQIASMNGRHVSDVTADYGGACPADMQPGDVILSNGMKVNPGKMLAGSNPTAPPGGDH